MKKSVVFAGCAIAISGLSTLALAHSGATGIVKERMDGMKAMSEVVKSLSAMMRGDTTYDPETVRKGAAVIRSHAGKGLTNLFPEGSQKHGSEAKPEIWSNWQMFSEFASQLEVYAEGLEVAAGNGLMANGGGHMMQNGQSGMMGGSGMMGSASGIMNADQLAQMPADGVFNMVAQTCSACHSRFRVEKK